MKSVGIPLVLTFAMDPDSKGRLDLWRQIHFPPERNHLSSHLTIYHQLPGQEITRIDTMLKEFAKAHQSLTINFAELKTRQGFVGISVVSPAMLETKAELDGLFGPWLRAQDRKIYNPHVTVTNLGSPKDAARTFETLGQEFLPWNGKILGLELYHYRGGPWELHDKYMFDA